MTLPLILAFATTLLGNGRLVSGADFAANYLTSGNTVVQGKGPLVLTKSSVLENYSYDGEIWLGDGEFTLRNVSCRGIRLSRVQRAELTNVRTNGADIGLWIIGSSNVTVRNSVFRNHRVGLEGGPGDPWTFADEAKKRNIQAKPENRWKLGMNLGGMLETKHEGISFIGNGTNRAAIRLGKIGDPPYKLDDKSPLSENHWEVTGKKFPKVVAESSQSFVLEAEGVFEKGKRYWAHTYSRKHEIKNINVFDSRFEKNSLAGVSLYFVDGSRIEGNYAPDVTSDYEYGVEHARNVVIANNRASTNGHKNIRIGLLMLVENITVRGNSLPVHYMHRNEPEFNLESDTPIKYVDGRSPWVTFKENN